MAIVFLAVFVAFVLILAEGIRTDDEHVELLGLIGIASTGFLIVVGVICVVIDVIAGIL